MSVLHRRLWRCKDTDQRPENLTQSQSHTYTPKMVPVPFLLDFPDPPCEGSRVVPTLITIKVIGQIFLEY